MTSKDTKPTDDNKDKNKLRAKVVADQAGSDAETGEALYQVELSLQEKGCLVSGTLVMEYSRDEYKALKDQQLSGDDDTVEVEL